MDVQGSDRDDSEAVDVPRAQIAGADLGSLTNRSRPGSEAFTITEDEAAALTRAVASFQVAIARIHLPALDAIATHQRKLGIAVTAALAPNQRHISDLWGPHLRLFGEQQAKLVAGFAQTAQVANQLAVLGNTASLVAEQVTAAWQAMASSVFDAFRLPPGFLEQFRRLAWEVPSSWPDDREEDVIEMIRVTDLPVGSIAPTHIVEACLDAHIAGDDPFTILHAHHGELVDELAVFAERDDGPAEHADARESLRLLVDLLVLDRFHRSVVRDAFAIVDDLLYKVAYRGYGDLRADRLVGGVHDLLVYGFRQRIVVHCLAPCYENFDKATDPVPSRLNRHAAVHTTSPLQANRENALVAALLAVNLLDAYYHDPIPA